MATITGDNAWTDTQSKDTAILLLEHKMVGPRLGTEELWDKLLKSKKIKDQIFEGRNTELNFFSDTVFPLAKASLSCRGAEVMSILRKMNSPLLSSQVLETNKADPLAHARAAEQLFRNVISDENVSFRAVLEVIFDTQLLKIPEKLKFFVGGSSISDNNSESSREEDEQLTEPEEQKDDSEIFAWTSALETSFYRIEGYKSYIEENSLFRTHQGVKGNEFERVMVIMDDDDAGGFLFSYEQYLGAKELSQDSKKKQAAGEEIGVDRTRRLFYATSTRAKSSLVHVIYTSDVTKIKTNLIQRKFAHESEIIEVKVGNGDLEIPFA